MFEPRHKRMLLFLDGDGGDGGGGAGDGGNDGGSEGGNDGDSEGSNVGDSQGGNAGSEGGGNESGAGNAEGADANEGSHEGGDFEGGGGGEREGGGEGSGDAAGGSRESSEDNGEGSQEQNQNEMSQEEQVAETAAESTTNPAEQTTEGTSSVSGNAGLQGLAATEGVSPVAAQDQEALPANYAAEETTANAAVVSAVYEAASNALSQPEGPSQQDLAEIAAAAGMVNGEVTVDTISANGMNMTAVTVRNNDTGETTVAYSGTLADGTTVQGAMSDNTSTGIHSEFNAVTGESLTVNLGPSLEGMPSIAIGNNIEFPGLSGTPPPAGEQSGQSQGIPQSSSTQQDKQSFGVGSSAEQEPFSTNSGPLGALPETIGPRNERNASPTSEVPTPRAEKSPSPAEDRTQNFGEPLSSIISGNADVPPSSHLDQPAIAPLNPQNATPAATQRAERNAAGLAGAENVIAGLKGLGEGYIALKETAKAYEVSVAFLELAELAGEGSLVALSVAAWPVALGVGAGIGIGVGLVQATIGIGQVISSLTNSPTSSQTNEAAKEALSAAGVNGLLGFGYGVITNDPAAGHELGEQLDVFGEFWKSSTQGPEMVK